MLKEKKYSIPPIHPSFLLNDQSFDRNSLSAHAIDLIEIGETYEIEIGTFIQDWLNADAFLNLKTSGSTGVPKTIQVKKEYMVNSALATGKFFDLFEGTTALLCLSAGYIAGKMMLVRAMVLGWKIHTMEPKMNPLDSVFKQYDFCAMVPLQLDNSIGRLHLIKKMIVGGGTVSSYLIELVKDLDTKIYETYGMTETVSHIAARRINSKRKAFKDCYFKALPNVLLSVDERNCLVIKAPSVCESELITNDIVDLITYKKFEWKGRYDNVINSGGIKLYPEQIEKKLQVIIRERFFISSLPDDTLGNKLILIVENTTGSESEQSYFVRLTQLNTLEKYELPKEIFLLEKFLETPTKKVHRNKNLEQVVKNVENL